MNDVETLWRCTKCGKWSHAVKMPRRHQRFIRREDENDTTAPVGLIVTSEDEPYFGGYDDDTVNYGGWWVVCGPFAEWSARPVPAPYEFGSSPAHRSPTRETSKSTSTKGPPVMTETTELDLDAIEARVAAATDGPWTRDPTRAVCGPLTRRGNLVSLPSICDEFIRRSDADFVAHARTDVPALVAEVRRLRALVGAA